MKSVSIILLLIGSHFLIEGCSIIRLTSGIIIDSRSYQEKTVNEDTLKALTSRDIVGIRLKDGKIHYGKFYRLERTVKKEAGITGTKLKKDSVSESEGITEWNLLLKKKGTVVGFKMSEIKRINIHKNTYAPIPELCLGFMIDFMVFNILKGTIDWRVG